MIVSDVLRRVQTAIGDSTGALVTTTNILDYVNDAQLAINAEAEVVRGGVGINTVAGTMAYALPADFLAPYSLEMDYSLATRYMLPYLSRNEVYSRYPALNQTSERGAPVGYFIDGGFVNFFPIPIVAGSASFTYVKIPTAVTAVGNSLELPASLHPLVVRMVVALVKEVDEDYEAAQMIKSEIFTELGLTKSRFQQTDNSYAIIRDDDPWALTYE